MNRTAVKSFAIWARNKLIADITYKAGLMGVTGKGISEPLPQSSNDVQFFDIGTTEPYSISGHEITQRQQLVKIIHEKAKQSDYHTAFTVVIEEVAYTWFNRLIAIRFMEVNDYLPSRVRVLSSENPAKAEPDLVTRPFDADLPFTATERELVLQLKIDNELDELFRYLFIKQCNELNKVLPKLFEKTNDYTELLLNVTFTDKDAVVWRLVNDIEERDFKVCTSADEEAIARGEISEEEAPAGQVEIIGWLYQYYNTEPKQEVFDLLDKKVKITKERIPAATQLFTPNWIVRYMVENSLGRLWIERHPNDELKSKWKYYLDEAEQDPDVEEELFRMRLDHPVDSPEDITFIDPCMGSGHILVYAFEVLMQIYESCGYSQGDAALLILRKNLFGLDLGKRAYQLAYFSVLMKARQYNRRILFEHGSKHMNILCFQHAIDIDPQLAAQWGNRDFNDLLTEFKDVDNYGSLLKIKGNYNLEGMLQAIYDEPHDRQVSIRDLPLGQIEGVIKLAKFLTNKYDIVCTNPPYMVSRNMNSKLSNFVKKEYKDSKSDLFACFIEKCESLTKTSRYLAMITQHSWMFLSSYWKLREKLSLLDTVNMVHLGTRAFSDIGGEVVQSTAFIIRTNKTHNFSGVYLRLTDFPDAELKEQEFLSGNHHYIARTKNFTKIPGMPVAYWVDKKIQNIFDENVKIDDIAFPRQGLATGDNDKFLRQWYEVSNIDFAPNCSNLDEFFESNKKYVPYNKGGVFRKWYANIEWAIRFDKQNYRILQTVGNHLPSKEFYFRESITWSKVTSSSFSMRYVPKGSVFDVAGCSIFSDNNLLFLLGLSNSKVMQYLLNILSQTLNYEVGNIKSIPVIIKPKIYSKTCNLVDNCILLSQEDNCSQETVFNFSRHPFLSFKGKALQANYRNWKTFTESQFLQLKANEEELNRIFIDIYGLQDELTPEVAEKDITITRIYDKQEDIPESMKGNNYVLTKADVIKSFISYAVGCMFGRYSLDVDGLAFAGGDWDDSKYSTFIPDKDNILLITDEEYYEDDIVGLFVALVKKVYGAETLEENLNFISNALGGRGDSSREIIRNYFLKDFFKDHCKTYKKRPIYWLFDSGRTNGFKALVYMHRYDENTIGNLRIDYLHQIQQIYTREISRMQETIDNSSNGREVAAAEKRKEKLTKQLKETTDYDEKISHLALARNSIDLDDGVKVNYEKMQTDADVNKLDVLAKIR